MKHFFKKPVSLVILLLLFFSGKAQFSPETKNGDSSIYYVRQVNGLNAILYLQNNAPNLVLSYNVKIGPLYETDSNSGICYIIQSILSERIKNYLSDVRNPLNVRNASYYATGTPEITTYQITTTPANYRQVLKLMRDFLNPTGITVTEEELNTKIQQVKAEIENASKDYLTDLNTRLKKNIFRKDAYRQLVKGDTASFKFITAARIDTFIRRTYVSTNVVISATGSFDQLQFQRDMADTFKVMIKPSFDPKLVTRIIDFKPMVYNSRFVINAPVQQPEIQICWQFPGTRANVRSSYYGFLLNAMLNDPDNYIQVKARKMGCRKLSSEYEANNFSGVLKVVIDPDKANFAKTYEFVFGELQKLDKMLLNETMLSAGKILFRGQYDQIKKSSEYARQVMKYWVYNDESYYSTLKDSVLKQSEDRMRVFILEYINQSQHATAILVNDSDRAALMIDSLYPPIDESLNNSTFTYRQNISDIEGPENKTKLYNLLCWMKENPDLIIQVNGKADRKELTKFHDDSIQAFIDSMPTFSRSRDHAMKTGSIRLEMLRSMKIIKYLYDNGIDIMRLKGTSMTFASKDKEEEQENMSCNVSVDKIIRSPSLYEYHYGKPKEPEKK